MCARVPRTLESGPLFQSKSSTALRLAPVTRYRAQSHWSALVNRDLGTMGANRSRVLNCTRIPLPSLAQSLETRVRWACGTEPFGLRFNHAPALDQRRRKCRRRRTFSTARIHRPLTLEIGVGARKLLLIWYSEDPFKNVLWQCDQ